MEILDAILELLADGQWHPINELTTPKQLSALSITKLIMTLNTLEEYNILELSEEWNNDTSDFELSPTVSTCIQKVRLTHPMQKFMRRIKWIERAEKAKLPHHT